MRQGIDANVLAKIPKERHPYIQYAVKDYKKQEEECDKWKGKEKAKEGGVLTVLPEFNMEENMLPAIENDESHQLAKKQEEQW